MLGVPTETQSEVPPGVAPPFRCWWYMPSAGDRIAPSLPVDALALGVALEPDERVPLAADDDDARARRRWPFLYVAVGNSETCAIIELPASENFMLKPGPRSVLLELEGPHVRHEVRLPVEPLQPMAGVGEVVLLPEKRSLNV